MSESSIPFSAYVRLRRLEAALRRTARELGFGTIAYGPGSPVGTMRQELAIVELVVSVDKELRRGLEAAAEQMARTLVMGCPR